MSTNNRSTRQQRAASSKRLLTARSFKLVAVLAFVSVVAVVYAGPPVCCPPPRPADGAKAYGPGSSQALVIELNRSLLMKFQKMERVAVVDPAIADVTVVSVNELLLRAIGLGETMMYVWDQGGLNKFAVSVVGKSAWRTWRGPSPPLSRCAPSARPPWWSRARSKTR